MARDPVKTADLKAVAADHVTGSAATCEYKYYGPYDPRAREAESRERTPKGQACRLCLQSTPNEVGMRMWGVCFVWCVWEVSERRSGTNPAMMGR